MPAPASLTLVHHLLVRPDDLVVSCGQVPGREDCSWHTACTPTELVAAASQGEGCCVTCLSLAGRSAT